ncbi:hypothetical protein [Microvirga ossetica]|nr:hypothetical protein [Microvirga ossetica]
MTSPTRAEMRALGCTEATIAYLFVNPKTESILRHPEDWFWIDKKWWKTASKEVVRNLHEICGGCFGDLSLEDQCALLDIPLTTIPGRKLPDGKCVWQLPSGAKVNIENFALDVIRKPGEQGMACEGTAAASLHMIVGRQFNDMHGHDIAFDETRQRPFQPGKAHADKVMAALHVVLNNPKEVYLRHRGYLDGLMYRPFVTVMEYLDLVGDSYFERTFRHRYETGAGTFGGCPDLTLRGISLRFVEVKGTDKLHGNQAMWIRDCAKPLGLDVSVVRVMPEGEYVDYLEAQRKRS